MLVHQTETPEARTKRKTSPLTYFPLFAETYLKIRTKDGSLVPFVMNEAQRRAWALIEKQEDDGDPVRVIILKARQMGISTLAEGYTFWQVVTHEYRRALVIAHDLDGTEGLFQMSKLFFDELPALIRPMRRYVNRRELVFENPDERARIRNPGLRSSFEVQTSNNVRAGRSGTAQHIHASEVSFWQSAEELTTAMFPAIPSLPTTSVIFESTAHGAGNWFHSFWKAALAEKSEYAAIFLPWYIMPEYRARVRKRLVLDDEERLIKKRFRLDDEQLEWRRRKIVEFEADNAGLGVEVFHQEYPNTQEEAFVASGLPALDHKGIARTSDGAKPGLRFSAQKGVPQEDGNGSLQVWERPQDRDQYTIGVDVSGGLEHGDLSTIEVVRNRERVQVAEWAGYVDPISLAPIIHNIALWYNEALVAIEVNNQGIATQRALIDDYWNIYCVAPETQILRSDLTWVSASALRLGESVLAFDEVPPPGHRVRRYKLGVVECVDRDTLPSCRVRTSDGDIQVSVEHPFLAVLPYGQSMWKSAADLRAGDRLAWLASPWRSRQDWQSGWLTGMLEAEGCLVRKSGQYPVPFVAVAQKPGRVLDRLAVGLAEFHGRVANGKTNGTSAVVVDRFSEVLRLLGGLRPERLLEKHPCWWDGVSVKSRGGNAMVIAVEPLGDQPVITLQTSARTFIANGFLSHNTWKYLDSVSNRSSHKLGWVTTISTKPMMLSFMNHCLQHGLTTIHSPDLRDEMYTYIRKGTEMAYAEAAPNCHDDRVMAFMIAITVQHIEEHGLSFGSSPKRVARDRSYQPIEYDTETGTTRFVGLPLPQGERRGGTDWRIL